MVVYTLMWNTPRLLDLDPHNENQIKMHDRYCYQTPLLCKMQMQTLSGVGGTCCAVSVSFLRRHVLLLLFSNPRSYPFPATRLHSDKTDHRHIDFILSIIEKERMTQGDTARRMTILHIHTFTTHQLHRNKT